MNILHFLIIDDDQIDRAIYQRIFKQTFDFPYKVIEATTALEGLEAAKNNYVDCILLDYQLPDMLGSDLVPLLKKAAGKFVPIVMLTGQGSEEVAVNVMKTGVVDYISKVNLDPQQLSLAVKYVVKQAHLKKIIYEQKKKIQFYTFYDSLTGLKNRHTFEEMAAMTFANAVAFNHSLAILLIDLDNFTTVNDTFGYLAGNDVLIEIGNRLQSIVPKQALIARFGEDEFSVLLTGPDVEASANMVAQSILEKIHLPYIISDEEILVKASIGVACYTATCPDLFTLLKQANTALVAAKQAGGGLVKV